MLIEGLPTGFSFHARKWNIADQRIFLPVINRNPATVARAMVQVASDKVENPGPYPFTKGGKVDWDKVMDQDISVANMLMRAHTKRWLDVQPMCSRCGERPAAQLSIDMFEVVKDLYPASDKGKECIRAYLENEQPTQCLVGQAIYSVVPLLGKDAERLGELVKSHKEAVADIQMAMHIVHVRTEEGVELSGFQDILGYIGRGEWDVRPSLEDLIDDLFGGLEEIYDWTCKQMVCNQSNQDIVPLDLSFYGLDTGRRQRRRQRHSTAGKSQTSPTPNTSLPSAAASPELPPSTSEDGKL